MGSDGRRRAGRGREDRAEADGGVDGRGRWSCLRWKSLITYSRAHGSLCRRARGTRHALGAPDWPLVIGQGELKVMYTPGKH